MFDLDGTLVESKSSLDAEMSGLLHDLLGMVKVAVISGGDWPQFEKQLLSNLPHGERLVNLSILPSSGYFTVCLTPLRIRRLQVHGLEKGWAAECPLLRNITF